MSPEKGARGMLSPATYSPLSGILSAVVGAGLLALAATPRLWHQSTMSRSSLILRCVCGILGVALMAIAVLPVFL